MTYGRNAVAIAAALLTMAAGINGQQQTPPTFRSTVEVTRMDVTVVDDNGKPLQGLTPADFKVRVDGKDRRVVSAQWIALTTAGSPAPAVAPSAPPAGYSTNEHATDGRLIVIAVDQPNIRAGGAMGIRSAVEAFISHLEPSDRIAAVSLGHGLSTPFTADRKAVLNAIALMSGDQRPVTELTDLNLAVAEAVDINAGDEGTLNKVSLRICGFASTVATSPCITKILTSAFAVSNSARTEARQSLASLKGLLDGLKAIKAPKTVVLVTEGFVARDETDTISDLGRAATAAQTTLYVLKLDEQMFDTARRERSPSPAGDRQLRIEGVEHLASITKGDVFNVLGTGSSAFARIEREVSGYYLVGVESTPTDTDGKEHRLNVQISRTNAIVRARRELANPEVPRASAAAPLDAVREAMRSPLMVSNLPLHVATFSVRDGDPSKIYVWIHADVGHDYTSPTDITLGYIVSDAKGTVVVNQVGDGRLAPAAGSAASPLVLTSAATLAPGDYTLKLVVNEGGRVGSIEHPVHAGLVGAGSVKLSELMVGGPADARELLRPSIGNDVNFGGVQGYLEAYGVGAGAVARYELARSANGPAVAEVTVPGRSASDGRVIFSAIVPTNGLTAGQYQLRATVLEGSTAIAGGRVARTFNIPRGAEGRTMSGIAGPTTASVSGGSAPASSRPDAVRPSAAPAAPAAAAAAPVARPFRREAALEAQTLQRFRATLASGARKDFEEGIASLTAGDFVKAEVSFKNAQRAGDLSSSSAAPLAYLGATYAASGHDLEAANVWQNALIDGAEYPQLYEWLADTQVRVRRFEDARSMLKEALEKWPTDARFIERLATVPALPNAPADAR